MDLHETLKLLDLPGGDAYHRSRIPNRCHSRVGRAVASFTAASPGGQAALREAIDEDRAGLLRAWSERLAALGVRLESQGPLVQGLVALSLAQEADGGEALLVAPLHRRSAEKLGLDADRVFDAACGRTDPVGARWLRAARDCRPPARGPGCIEDEARDGFSSPGPPCAPTSSRAARAPARGSSARRARGRARRCARRASGRAS